MKLPVIALLCLLFMMVITPYLATHDPIHAESGHELESYSHEHWFGTDRLGRDVWSRFVVGGQRTLSSALLATLIATGGGLLLGSLGNFGPLQSIIRLLIDALLAFPAILLALVIRTLLEGNLLTLALAVGVANLATYSRVTMDALQVAQHQPYIEGARSIGASQWRLVTRHIIPAALPTLASFGAVVFAWSLLYASALAFLGLGGDPTQPDWGIMLQQGQGTIVQAPRLVILPASALALSVWLAYAVADTYSISIRKRSSRL